jgi:guanine nucleotide-binding protein subunit alpha
MKLIYSQGFSKNEKLEWKPIIFNNIIQAFQTIRDAMAELDIEFDDPENEVSHSLRLPSFHIYNTAPHDAPS